METNVGTLVLINVYMPYYCANNLENHSEDYLDTLAFIDSVVDRCKGCYFVVLGDMNCNFYGNDNRFSNMLHHFIMDKNFYCAYNFLSNFDSRREYTRFNEQGRIPDIRCA